MIVNLTPHKIVYRGPMGDEVFEPSGQVARVSTEEVEAPHISGLPCIRRELGEADIPLKDGDIGIVSSMVLAACEDHPARNRLIAPDTGPTAVREDGQVVAVTRFVRL